MFADSDIGKRLIVILALLGALTGAGVRSFSAGRCQRSSSKRAALSPRLVRRWSQTRRSVCGLVPIVTTLWPTRKN
jgi:hypothetical protein